MTVPMHMNLSASDLVEIELWLDPVMVTPTEVGHINGALPYRTGDYVSPFNLVPQLITSFDSTQTEFAITQEDPTNEKLTINTQYASGDLLTLDVSFNDYRVLKSGRLLGSFLVDAKGASIDLKVLFQSQREVLTTEFDSPTEFPPASASITVSAFDSSTGLITCDRAFPLRIYEGQRVQLGSTNYYVLSVDSVHDASVFNSASVEIPIAKLDVPLAS